MSIFDEREKWVTETELEFSEADFIPWLKTQTYETWHEVVLGWNWDNGPKELLWISSQPECDMGTACHLFFSGAAGFLKYETQKKAPSDWDKQYWQMFKTIAQRWTEKTFKNSELFPFKSGAGFDLEYVKDRSYYIGYTNGYTDKEYERRRYKNIEKVLPWNVHYKVYQYWGTRHSDSEYEFENRCRYEKFSKWQARQK